MTPPPLLRVSLPHLRLLLVVFFSSCLLVKVPRAFVSFLFHRHNEMNNNWHWVIFLQHYDFLETEQSRLHICIRWQEQQQTFWQWMVGWICHSNNTYTRQLFFATNSLKDLSCAKYFFNTTLGKHLQQKQGCDFKILSAFAGSINCALFPLHFGDISTTRPPFEIKFHW